FAGKRARLLGIEHPQQYGMTERERASTLGPAGEGYQTDQIMRPPGEHGAGGGVAAGDELTKGQFGRVQAAQRPATPAKVPRAHAAADIENNFDRDAFRGNAR